MWECAGYLERERERERGGGGGGDQECVHEENTQRMCFCV